ncbi:unnamed protein product [Prorocentrum cordatum]|uniref:Uncharacterized protein n=1 Tax=Prorocentrum cordatum TaxID=2364126 RepID=A0ABN9V215_9DINO|nr:unnamed protein product [Polarella glacialis]
MQLGSVYFFPGAVPHAPAQGALRDPAVAALLDASSVCGASAQRDLLCDPHHGFPSDWHLGALLARAPPSAELGAALRALPELDERLLSLLGEAPRHEEREGARKRRRRLGGPERRAELLPLARAEAARRRAGAAQAAECRAEAARHELLARGVLPEHAEQALSLAGGSALRAEAVLRVALERYRQPGDRAADGGAGHTAAGDFDMALASRVLYDISPWLGGQPCLALEALGLAAGDTSPGALERAVGAIAERQQHAFSNDVAARVDAAIEAAAGSVLAAVRAVGAASGPCAAAVPPAACASAGMVGGPAAAAAPSAAASTSTDAAGSAPVAAASPACASASAIATTMGAPAPAGTSAAPDAADATAAPAPAAAPGSASVAAGAPVADGPLAAESEVWTIPPGPQAPCREYSA